MHRALVLSAALAAGSAGVTQAVGFTLVEAPGMPEVGLWYPSDEPAPPEPNTPFRQSLALDAAPAGRALPLVVISHGNQGWMGGHAGTALSLARRGYVVAAPTHVGDNGRDESASPARWLVSRPREVGAVIDHLLDDWEHASVLDADRIGVFGFSAGGYTALVAAGAEPGIALARRHCAESPQEFVCRIGLLDDVEEIESVDPDERIGAVAVAAPGLGFAFSRQGLSAVDVPVQIWSGSDDERVPSSTNGERVAANLPGEVDERLVEGGGHFAFLEPCDPAFERVNPTVWAMVCVDSEGFDRAAFLQHFDAALADFFDGALDR